MAKILVVSNADLTDGTYNTPDVERWELDREEWEDSDPVQKRLMVDGLMGCEELWPGWFRKEAEEFRGSWNEEVERG
jgi:hypothetical protein